MPSRMRKLSESLNYGFCFVEVANVFPLLMFEAEDSTDFCGYGGVLLNYISDLFSCE
jgi:hypothetical protein